MSSPDNTPAAPARQGFTMLELVAVLVVVAVLAGVSIVAYQQVTTNARLAADKTTALTILREAQALHAFTGDDGPPTSAEVQAALDDLAAGQVLAADTPNTPIPLTGSLGSVAYATDGTTYGAIAFIGSQSDQCIYARTDNVAWPASAGDPDCDPVTALAGPAAPPPTTTSTTAAPTTTTIAPGIAADAGDPWRYDAASSTIAPNASREGILWWLGTNGSADAWANPSKVGMVSTVMSASTTGVAQNGTDRDTATVTGSGNTIGSCYTIDFGPRTTVALDAYDFGQRNDGYANYMRSWDLKGANASGGPWTTLYSHRNDATAAGAGDWGRFTITNHNPWRYLQLCSVDPGSGRSGTAADHKRMEVGDLEFYGTVTRTSVDRADGSTARYAWESNGDTNGVIHAIGTGFRDHAFANPTTSGHITVTASAGTRAGTFAGMTARDADASQYWSSSQDGNTVTFDLGPKIRVRPLTYALQSPNSGYNNFMHSWLLQGSNDGTTWTTIDTRNNDRSIAAYGAWGAWDVSTDTAFRYFRINRNGWVNGTAADHKRLEVGEFELYGDVLQTP